MGCWGEEVEVSDDGQGQWTRWKEGVVLFSSP